MSPIIVQKFGGTSVGDADRIRNVAARIAATAEAGNQVVAVVSAMGSTTNDLRRLAASISDRPPPRELDMLLSSGERISMSLVAMAIHALGHEAESYTGSQAGIITDALHGGARIADVRPTRIVDALERGTIPIIAGFQGVSEDTHDITTLGKGASDLTAIALAAALEADVCEIYTDVDGVYTADPRLCPSARKLHAVSYEEMLEMASSGARVLQARSVELARGRKVLVHVRSSFDQSQGTFIREEDERMMEKAIISAVTHDASEAKVTVVGVPDKPGMASAIFRSLSDAGANVDMIVQNVSHSGRTDMSFTVPKLDLQKSLDVVAKVAKTIGAETYTSDEAIARVSLIGAGMKSHPGVAADMFESLADAGVNIEMISTSPIRISCVIREDQVEQAVQAVHERFKLSDEVVLRASTGEHERRRLAARYFSSMGFRVGVVGATGATGKITLSLLRERNFPVDELRVFASSRSAGQRIGFGDGEAVSRTSPTRLRGLGRRPQRYVGRPRAGVRPEDGRGGRHRERQVIRVPARSTDPARRPRDQRPRGQGAQGDHREPELHDRRRRDGSRTAAPRDRRPVSDQLVLPVGLRRRT